MFALLYGYIFREAKTIFVVRRACNGSTFEHAPRDDFPREGNSIFRARREVISPRGENEFFLTDLKKQRKKKERENNVTRVCLVFDSSISRRYATIRSIRD